MQRANGRGIGEAATARRPRRCSRYTAVMAAGIASVLAGGLVAGRAPVHVPLAVALVQTGRGSELVTVDLRRLRVARRVRLKSLCLSMDADALGRRVVTAQCGGPDDSADRYLGVYSPGARRVRYLDLGVPNPLDVCIAGSSIVAIHGVERPGGLVTSIVRLSGANYTVAHSLIGPGALRPRRAGNRVLVPVLAVSASGVSSGIRIVRIDSRGGSIVDTELSGSHAALVAEPDAAPPPTNTATLIVRGGRKEDHRSWSIVECDAAGRVVNRKELPALEHGVSDACRWGGDIVIADADGVDMSDPGDTLLLVHPSGGVSRLRLPGGMPAAVRAWGAKLLVADGVSGDIVVFRRGFPDPVARVALGGVPIGAADVAVFP